LSSALRQRLKRVPPWKVEAEASEEWWHWWMAERIERGLWEKKQAEDLKKRSKRA
jgi:hypothetical protein